MDMSLTTKCTEWRRLYATNSTAVAYTTRVDTPTKPSGDGVFDLLGSRGEVPNTIAVQFFGTDGNDKTGSARVYGVSPVTESGLITAWHFTPLFSGTFILNGSLPGISGGAVSNLNYYADTIARTAGAPDVGDSVISPEDDFGAATLLVDNKGFHLVFVEPIRGTATSVNAMARGV